MCGVNRIREHLVGEISSQDDEPLSTSLFDVQRSEMGECDVSNIYPSIYAGWRQWIVAQFALNERQYSLVGGVQFVQTGKVMSDRSKNQRRIQRDKIEIWLLLLDEIPGRLLSKRLHISVNSWRSAQIRSALTLLTMYVKRGLSRAFCQVTGFHTSSSITSEVVFIRATMDESTTTRFTFLP